MQSALQKITGRAKQLRRANKNLSWKEAIKKASAEYNRGSKPKTEKKSVLKKARKRRAKSRKGLKLSKGKRAAAGSGLGSGVRSYLENEIRNTLRAIETLKKEKTAAARRTIREKRKHISSMKKALRDQNSYLLRMLK